MVEKTDALERSLWSAVRALEERTDRARRLARRMRQADLDRIAERDDDQEVQSEEAAQVIRQVLLSGLVSNQTVPHDDEDLVNEARGQAAAS